MDVTLSELLASFMESPLVLWVSTLGPLGSGEAAGSEERVNMYMELVDGVFLHKIMSHIDPSPTNQRLNKNVNNDVSLRLYNLTVLTRHIKTFYQETLQQLIVMPLPNILLMAKDPMSAQSMEELRNLLLLLLGCAVQCERKEEMIEKIKLLDIQTQAAIVSHIQEVTHNQQNVLDVSWAEDGAEPEDLDLLSRSMATALRRLIEQRDRAAEAILDLTQERDYLSSRQPQDGGGPVLSNGSAGAEPSKQEKQHLMVELVDAKAKLRRYRQELEEKTEQLMDSKHEGERLDQELQKLRQENQSLSCEARSVRAYRDEVDSLRERAARVDRLEAELGRCKEKLHDVHFYKSRVEELREDNMTLLETKVLLEEQLAASRGRCDKLHSLEKDNLLLRAKLHDLEMERDSERRRLEELVEENMLLEMGQKQSMNESAHLGWELEQLTKNHGSAAESQKSLVQELNECVSSRVLKVEKENRELQASLERLVEENHLLQKQQLHAQELDRENQNLSSKLQRLQDFLDQERLTNQDMESLGEELLKDKENLQRELQALRADSHRQVSELESEKQHLAEEVRSLQERAQRDSEARVREAEAKNRLLHQSVADASSRLASLETQLTAVSEEADGLREQAGRCQEAQREAARLERSKEALSREVASLRGCSERAEALDRQVTSLQQEVLRLQQEAQEAQKELQRLAKENLELRCCVESLRSSSARLPSLQEELQEAQRQSQEGQRRLEEAREEAQGERKRAERLEQNLSAVNQEKHRLQEEVERSREERLEALAQVGETRSKEEELRREVEELREERRRREEGDAERKKLQQDLEQSEESRKQLEKESWRVGRLLEAKELELEEASSREAASLKEAAALRKEAERLKEASARAKELERENKELQKQTTIHRRTLATLREELVCEKLNVQQQKEELERLKEEQLQEEVTQEDSRFRLLETRLEETLRMKEEKISSLEQQLQESRGPARPEPEPEPEPGAQQNPRVRVQVQARLQGADGATAELLRIQDHLIALEKSNASLQTESGLLKEQLRQLQGHNASLSSQMGALQRHASALQEQNSALHTQTAQLQVENSAVASQSASLMAQNAVLQGQVGALEAEAEAWQRQRDEAWRARESALSDHERLLGVHERQAHEYEQLIGQHAALKAHQRALESERRALQAKYCALLQLQETMEEQQGQKEAEELKQEVQKNRLLQQENLQLKTDVDRLSQSQSQQAEAQQGLQQRVNELKSSLSSAQQEVSQWMSRYDALMDQHQNLDLTMTKLDNHCELLSRLKGNLEEENHHLLSQINLLSQQNHTLLERSMESKELYHQEQKLYIDKLNALRRHKEKLEEKIMDQYKFYDPTPKKRSQWAGAKALVKLIKPRKEGSRERGPDQNRDQDRNQDRNRDRAKSAPDLPLPATPPPLPPEAPPPPPQRTASDPHSGAGPAAQSPAGSNRGPAHQNRLTSTPNLQPPSVSRTSSSRPVSQRSRGPFDEDSVFGRPGSGDFSHHTSSSSSPITCRDASDRQLRSASLSSDDVMGLSQSQQSLSRSSTLPYDHTPQRAQPQRGGGSRTKPRPGSPGSDMVTLEEFLEESNLLSPPLLSTGSTDELMTDYFTRSPAPSAPSARDQATPTSYVSPTVHSSNQRPGQSVKPSPRQPLGQSPASQRTGQSLSRAFSLASADLLRSQGPDSYRGNEADGVVRRQGGGASHRERPMSARFGAADFLSPSVPHSASLNLQTERSAERERDRGRSSVSRNGPRGEVAMVTPVRAVPPGEASEGGDVPRQGDSAPCNKDGSPERAKSTPASPDPNNDPQTVWYEYGCV